MPITKTGPVTAETPQDRKVTMKAKQRKPKVIFIIQTKKKLYVERGPNMWK